MGQPSEDMHRKIELRRPIWAGDLDSDIIYLYTSVILSFEVVGYLSELVRRIFKNYHYIFQSPLSMSMPFKRYFSFPFPQFPISGYCPMKSLLLMGPHWFQGRGQWLRW